VIVWVTEGSGFEKEISVCKYREGHVIFKHQFYVTDRILACLCHNYIKKWFILAWA
jgi:hypothetical protein